MKYIMIVISLIGFGYYEYHKTNTIELELLNYKKQNELQTTIYQNKINDLSKKINNQNNQIKALISYTSENNKNNNTINDLKKEYNTIIPNSKNITNYQNKLFDNFGRWSWEF